MVNFSVVDLRSKSDSVGLISEDLGAILDSANYPPWILVKLHNCPSLFPCPTSRLGVINEMTDLKVPGYLKSIRKEKKDMKGKDRRLYKAALDI